jgi:hypothetical protein
LLKLSTRLKSSKHVKMSANVIMFKKNYSVFFN